MYDALTLQYAFIYNLQGFHTESLNKELETIKRACGIASELENMGVFQLEIVKIVLTSHFHKEVRATIGLVPTSQLP